MISYGKQSVDQSDIDSVADALKSDWLTQGPKTEDFEDSLKDFFRSEYACVVSNGTAALHLAGISLDWKPGDIIITSPITFLASANSIIYCGATPDFVDIDKYSHTIDPNLLEDKIKKYVNSGKKVKAVVAVDYAGLPCDWAGLKQIADKYEVQLINDNCHALGSEYDNDIGYAVKYADVVTHSYHPVKHITCGEGGSVLTNNYKIDDKIRSLRSHGMTKEVDRLSANDGPWYYEMHDLGYNYRITDFQCALGINQLKKLPDFLKKRRKIAEKYDKDFSNVENITSPITENISAHSYHLYPLQIDFSATKIEKQKFFNKMKANGFILQVHYIPIHFQPYYQRNFGFKKGDFPISEEFYKQEVSIPIYPDLMEEDRNKFVQLTKALIK